ncbi:flavin reductase family protein [Streptococcus pseudoporcinus]|uniref:Flavin reductase like domain n=1 Tax=Streptococcus pseudoporcinus TaxID=361101 RepID=A0A4U9YGN9_9STRE|nr:flavin reductase family protein [Streptococcus pseudoporcinus]VTS25813.1 Flavin reductase like domain [Streptococcus pseudoporcinus]VUC71514.1 Flavin reductase like domain [Streptococcus pseudoporcinus]VUD00871.1 Flavin reductase like domain [Streptococcus pseudoporcinus]VUD01183.1 Flavin reductase like domain [Streptococcus pseudoporcinus]
MISLATDTLTHQQIYKLLIGSVIPRPIAFVTTLTEEGQVNLAPFSFYTIVSHQPAIISISIQRQNGRLKDTARNIIHQKEAVIHSVSAHNLTAVNQAAKPLSYGHSELPLTGMTLVDSSSIQTPGVSEALGRFEAKLFQHIPISNDQKQVIADLLLLQIVHFHIDEKIYQDGYISPEALEPISRLAGSTYAKIGELFSLERPE